MGIIYNPRIITDGLVLCLDAGNRRSYPGTGTTWFDLSGNENNGTFSGDIDYSGNNSGSLFYYGNNDKVEIPFNATSMDFSAAQTICMWIKPITGSNNARRNPYNQAYGGPGTLTHETNGTINYYFGTNGGNGSPYKDVNSTFTVSPNELAFITVARSQALNLCNWYKNGILTKTDNAGGYAATANGNLPILIGDGYVSSFLGNIYDCKVYNKFLTSSEIQQNFNATRGRFGI